MSKQKKKQMDDAVETVETVVEEQVEMQADEVREDFAETENQTQTVEKQEEQRKQKSGGTAIALLALLIALGIGGAGYFFGSQKLGEVESQIAVLNNKTSQLSSSQTAQTAIEMPTFDAEKAQIAELTAQNVKALERIAQLEREQSAYTAHINNLQLEMQKVTSSSNDKSAWVLSDTNSLLQNAVRKLSLDNDVETAKALLQEADAALSKVNNPHVATVRQAIQADLSVLNNINEVDQNTLMLNLTNLANRLDDLPLLENNETAGSELATGEVSDSIDDWQQNLEKSANSFLDKFIRVSNRNKADEKAFVAPNQEVYLRENIRLRLQIATLAIPRQQNELYKQSLSTVGSWIRSYFDTENDNVKAFLKSLDELREQSIYVDAPRSLQSLSMLSQMLNRPAVAVAQPEMKAEKLDTPEQPAASPQPEAAQQ